MGTLDFAGGQSGDSLLLAIRVCTGGSLGEAAFWIEPLAPKTQCYPLDRRCQEGIMRHPAGGH